MASGESRKKENELGLSIYESGGFGGWSWRFRPAVGEEIFERVPFRVPIAESIEHIDEVFPFIQAVTLGTRQYRHDVRGIFRRLGTAEEEPVFATNDELTQGPLRDIIVNAQETVRAIPSQGGFVFQGIGTRLT